MTPEREAQIRRLVDKNAVDWNWPNELDLYEAAATLLTELDRVRAALEETERGRLSALDALEMANRKLRLVWEEIRESALEDELK